MSSWGWQGLASQIGKIAKDAVKEASFVLTDETEEKSDPENSSNSDSDAFEESSTFQATDDDSSSSSFSSPIKSSLSQSRNRSKPISPILKSSAPPLSSRERKRKKKTSDDDTTIDEADFDRSSGKVVPRDKKMSHVIQNEHMGSFWSFGDDTTLLEEDDNDDVVEDTPRDGTADDSISFDQIGKFFASVKKTASDTLKQTKASVSSGMPSTATVKAVDSTTIASALDTDQETIGKLKQQIERQKTLVSSLEDRLSASESLSSSIKKEYRIEKVCLFVCLFSFTLVLITPLLTSFMDRNSEKRYKRIMSVLSLSKRSSSRSVLIPLREMSTNRASRKSSNSSWKIGHNNPVVLGIGTTMI